MLTIFASNLFTKSVTCLLLIVTPRVVPGCDFVRTFSIHITVSFEIYKYYIPYILLNLIGGPFKGAVSRITLL